MLDYDVIPAIPYVEGERLVYSVWWSNGKAMFRRDSLDSDHPEQLYNHLKTHGITPEEFGIRKGGFGDFDKHNDLEHLTKEQLINEVIRLKKLLELYAE